MPRIRGVRSATFMVDSGWSSSPLHKRVQANAKMPQHFGRHLQEMPPVPLVAKDGLAFVGAGGDVIPTAGPDSMRAAQFSVLTNSSARAMDWFIWSINRAISVWMLVVSPFSEAMAWAFRLCLR